MTGDRGRVVIASRYWPTALSLIRSLGAAGFDVDLAASVPHKGESKFAASSRYVNRSVETVCRSIKTADETEVLQVIIDMAEKERGEGTDGELPVLLPADDYTSSLIDRNLDMLKSLYVTPDAMGGRQGAITELMNKRTQNRLASECGLPCPAEWVIDLRDINIPEDMIYPCYCKPVISFAGFKGEMAKCSSPDELREHLEYLKSRNPDREILVQEFIDIDREISIAGTSIRSRDKSYVRVIIPAAISKGRPAVYERGVAITGTLVPVDVLGELVSGIEKLLNTMDYSGMFDMDFHCSGDKIYFGEVNLRSGGTSYAYYLSGVNLPALTLKGFREGAESISDEEASLKEPGKTFVYEKVLWRDYIQGFLTKREVKEIVGNADFGLINDPSDPAPGKLYDKYVHESINKRKKKGIKKRVKRLIRPFTKPAKEMLRGYPQYRPGNARNKSAGPRVMIAGRNYSSNLCMARSVGLAGYDTELLRIHTRRPDSNNVLASMIPEAYSKYVKAFYICSLQGKSSRAVDALIRAADRERKMMLIPTDDVAAYIMDEYRDQLKDLYYLPDANGIQGGITALMSKSAQKEIAEGFGIPLLRGSKVRVSKGEYELPPDISYPCFVKPDVSRLSSKKRMGKCEDEEDLRRILDDIGSKLEFDMLIEEYTDIKSELSVLGLCCDGKVLCPGVMEAVDEGHGARRGVAATGQCLPPYNNDRISEELMNKLRLFMGSLGYTGLFDIDLVETNDGSIYFVELNLRCGASAFVLSANDINLAGMYADHILKGKPLPSEDELKSISADRGTVTFASEKVLLEEYADNNISKKDFDEAILSADIHFIMNDNDPKPYRRFMTAFDRIRKSRQND